MSSKRKRLDTKTEKNDHAQKRNSNASRKTEIQTHRRKRKQA
jgi:hypothetical protein